MKRIIATVLFAALCGCLLWQACALPSGNYTAPIVSLTTKAPIPAIKAAFAKAFGDTAQIEVTPDGKAYLTLENRHMSIQVFGRTYEANVMTIEGAEVVSEKREAFSDPVNGLFSEPETKTQTVPAAFRVPIRTDNSEHVLTITVDFMDAFMGKGNPHPTDVTLALGAWEEVETTEETTLPEDAAAETESAVSEPEAQQTEAQTAQEQETESGFMQEEETTAPADDAQTDAPQQSKGKTAAIVIAGSAVCLAILIIAPITIQRYRGEKK